MLTLALEPPRRPAPVDQALLWSTLLLLALGLVMVYSASVSIAAVNKITGRDPHFYLVRHAASLGLGCLLALAVFQVPVRAWQRLAVPLLLVALGLLVLVLVPGVGRSVNGSQRWLRFAGLGFQPSEFAKLAMVLYAAGYALRRSARMGSLVRGMLPLSAVMAVVGGLLLLEPDFGALMVVVTVTLGILFLGGLSARVFAAVTVPLMALVPLLIWLEPYRMARLVSFLDPWDDPDRKGYQLIHSLIAFGRGAFSGVGLGASVEKQFYLPEAHTDFLMAVIAEEMGLAGVLLVLVLFAGLVVRTFMVGRQAAQLERYFAALTAQGVGLWIGLQALINLGVNMGALPTKGLTLPLMSFGGSGILANLAGLAIVLRVDYENRQLMQGKTP